MPTYSLFGNILNSRIPGEFYSPEDMKRREAASELTGRAFNNPNMQGRRAQEYANYLGQGLSYDVEGLLSNVALKYGKDVAVSLAERMPTMSREELVALNKLVQQASRERGYMDERERMAYERAGMQYKQGQYQK